MQVRYPILVTTYYRNGNTDEREFRNMTEAREYMTLALHRNTVAECEWCQ